MASWIETTSWENTPGLAKIRQIGRYFWHFFLLTCSLWVEFQSRLFTSFCLLRDDTVSPSIWMKQESSCQEQSENSKWIINVLTSIIPAIAVVKSFQETAVAA